LKAHVEIKQAERVQMQKVSNAEVVDNCHFSEDVKEFAHEPTSAGQVLSMANLQLHNRLLDERNEDRTIWENIRLGQDDEDLRPA
jgi:hypothetical protein